jgi:acetyl-CoA synthetase
VSVTDDYRAVRDQLLTVLGQQQRAVEEFRWPELGERLNRAVDWLDDTDNNRPALIIVEEDGTSTQRSYGEMSRRCAQVAVWLAGRGVGRDDAVMVRLDDQVELWESMLAIMKRGAVIMATRTPADLSDRVDLAKPGG